MAGAGRAADRSSVTTDTTYGTAWQRPVALIY